MSEICTEYPAPATVGEKLALDLTTGRPGIDLYIFRKMENVLQFYKFLNVMHILPCIALYINMQEVVNGDISTILRHKPLICV